MSGEAEARGTGPEGPAGPEGPGEGSAEGRALARARAVWAEKEARIAAHEALLEERALVASARRRRVTRIVLLVLAGVFWTMAAVRRGWLPWWS
ncbi:hypothetical protein [Rubellimicrobium aerolatum]|uniref:Uncharacterized protein n=1 Tax=Rubellimicrobium aerolatum TaxID=490979 RepID=A0ABW0SG73_9RHOB|nr:hypothetical protein [Rubellimicrobium aerolatum]MBP1807323.1 hypothetical protein [Rubellimicrobium aerolatum]